MRSALLSLFAAVSAVMAVSTKPVMNPPFPMGQATADLGNELPVHSSTTDPWATGFIPQACYNEAKNQGLNPSDFQVVNVKYSDCSAPWAVCRHKSTSKSLATILQVLGQVPVGMRQYVANVMIIPTSVPNVCAYTVGSYTVFREDCYDVGVAAHEFTHVLDVSAALQDVVTSSGFPAGTPYSVTDHFIGAYNKDSATPTQYAHDSTAASGNLVEDFAETGRLFMSDAKHPGGLAAYTSGSGQIANQEGNYRSRLNSVIFPSGGVCTGKVDTTQAVSMSTGMKRSIGRYEARSSMIAGTNVPEIAVSHAAANYRFPPYKGKNATAA